MRKTQEQEHVKASHQEHDNFPSIRACRAVDTILYAEEKKTTGVVGSNGFYELEAQNTANTAPYVPYMALSPLKGGVRGRGVNEMLVAGSLRGTAVPLQEPKMSEDS